MLEVALYLALLSVISVGGMPSVMPELQRVVVDVNAWMSAEQFTQYFALAQAAPGPNVLVTALIGWHLTGVTGAFVALSAFCGPAAVLAYSVGGLWDRLRDAEWLKVFQRALVPFTVGMIFAVGYVLSTPLGLDWKCTLIAGGSAAALYLSKINPLWILAAGGLLGYFLY